MKSKTLVLLVVGILSVVFFFPKFYFTLNDMGMYYVKNYGCQCLGFKTREIPLGDGAGLCFGFPYSCQNFPTPANPALSLAPNDPIFNYSSYDPINYKSFTELVYKNYLTHFQQKDKGISFYRKKYRLKLSLPTYPTPISSDSDRRDLNRSIYSAGLPSVTGNQFNHFLTIRHKEITFKFFFQDILVGPLAKEAKVGETIDLYILFVESNEFNKDALILVNEFDTKLKQ